LCEDSGPLAEAKRDQVMPKSRIQNRRDTIETDGLAERTGRVIGTYIEDPCGTADANLPSTCVDLRVRTTRKTHLDHRPDVFQATLIFLSIGPSGMLPDWLNNLRGRDGKRQQQARKQGNEEAETGEAKGLGNGQLRLGRTRVSWREKAQIVQRAGECRRRACPGQSIENRWAKGRSSPARR